MSEHSKEFLDLLSSVTAKRPKTVIDHILKYGHITSEELTELYGYEHAPRAARDVRELGIPLITFRVKNTSGRSIAAYKFGDTKNIKSIASKSAGRTSLSKALKEALLEKYGAKCFIYYEEIDECVLQVDHRVPYEISGELDTDNIEYFMLLSPSANRAKSWTCEHCTNLEKKDKSFCLKCFWASPENYEHIAGKPEKSLAILFTGNEIEDYNKLISLSGKDAAQSTIKKILHDYLNKIE